LQVGRKTRPDDQRALGYRIDGKWRLPWRTGRLRNRPLPVSMIEYGWAGMG